MTRGSWLLCECNKLVKGCLSEGLGCTLTRLFFTVNCQYGGLIDFFNIILNNTSPDPPSVINLIMMHFF